MTKEQLKNILIENKCIASGDWDNENPFVGIELDVLYDIFEKEKQLWIDKACKLMQHWILEHDYVDIMELEDYIKQKIDDL